MNLAAGVYKWGTGLLIPTDITLTGTPTDVWIFQIAQNLTVSNGVHVHVSCAAAAFARAMSLSTRWPIAPT